MKKHNIFRIFNFLNKHIQESLMSGNDRVKYNRESGRLKT